MEEREREKEEAQDTIRESRKQRYRRKLRKWRRQHQRETETSGKKQAAWWGGDDQCTETRYKRKETECQRKTLKQSNGPSSAFSKQSASTVSHARGLSWS